MNLNLFTRYSCPEFNIVAHYTGNREKWLGRTVNILIVSCKHQRSKQTG